MTMIKQAQQLFEQGHFAKAGQLFQQILMNDKTNIEAMSGLGKVAIAMNSYQRAVDIFRRCLMLNDHIPSLYLSLAQACVLLRQFSEAENALLKAYALDNKAINVLAQLASFYTQSGDYQGAEHYLSQWRKLQPDSIAAFGLYVRINKIALVNRTDEDNHYIAKMQAFIENENSLMIDDSVPTEDKITLLYSLAELYHRAERYHDAFRYYQQANALQRNGINFSVNDMIPYFNELITTFDLNVFGKVESEISQKPSLIPIFIVGQPRSGSTLLEQMLSGHSEIETGGELPFIAGDIATGIYQLTGQHFPKGVQALSRQQCQQLGQHYLNNLQTLAPKASYIIDKMPANYQSIGLIKMILPHAKVLHITRDVRDVSWSIFKNYFAAMEPYFCSLTEIAQYHHQYQTVMQHWQQVLPDFFYTIAYETLVAEPEQSLKKILHYCQLDFQENCLTFATKQGYIGTLSDTQLRKGIVNNRQKAWLPYQQYLNSEPFTDNRG